MNTQTIKPWCIYRTEHPSGHFYQGKGKTHLVQQGKYTGSGIRYNLSLHWPGYEPSTWTTRVLATFDTEEEAYQAEENLVTHESLANPYCLNMMCGGRKGKYKTPSSLLRRYRSEEKRKRAAYAKLLKAKRIAEAKAKSKAKSLADKERAAAKLAKAKAAAKRVVKQRRGSSQVAREPGRDSASP